MRLKALAVERIRVRPEKYEGLGKREGVIDEIEIVMVSQRKMQD